MKEFSIQPGEAVGVVAAESLGEPSTQMLLRIFHSAGISSAVVTTGLPRILEIIDARKKPKSPMMHISMAKSAEKNYEKARDVRKKIEEVRVRGMIKGFSENLKAGSMVLELDREKMSMHEINARSIISKIEAAGAAAELDNDSIKVKIKKGENLRSTRVAFVNIRELPVIGIPRIRKAIVEQADNNTFFITTVGSNINGVMEVDGIDRERIYSNDIIEIMDVYGIEAARNIIARELYSTITAEGFTTSFRHLSLIADAMCFYGAVKSVGRHGIAGMKESVFARAAFEETVKHFVNAAIFSEKDNLHGVAENILIGKQIPVGTGFVKLAVKKEDLKKIRAGKGSR